MTNYDYAINTMKLRRIMDKMPNATEAEIKAEYIKNGGLLNESLVEGIKEAGIKMEEAITASPKKATVKKVKEVVKKTVKKVTKK